MYFTAKNYVAGCKMAAKATHESANMTLENGDACGIGVGVSASESSSL